MACGSAPGFFPFQFAGRVIVLPFHSVAMVFPSADNLPRMRLGYGTRNAPPKLKLALPFWSSGPPFSLAAASASDGDANTSTSPLPGMLAVI